ncbi:DNA cytosine methyltransferase [Clostridium sp. VAP23]|uniref:DNA cytosine methyltransferase n=1 Tax=Clostridium sp. VAP23 TaxID=2949981 RepID=UPI002079366F|nr:DNA cytosine methyltransferase [Clostridium sp. VAP23]
MLKIVDLFSGVGGLSYGFMQAGGKVVVANEIDSDIAFAYTKNHPGTKMINEDITKLDIDTIFEKYKGEIDVVIGGPPCQGFSQKGSRKTIHDERNFLFRYYYNVVKFLRPKYFLMENVPNLLTAEKGLFKNEIEKLFNEIGYNLDSGVLNAADFGIPQTRRRAFILGKLGKNNLKLPVGTVKRVTINEAIGDLAFLESGEGREQQAYKYEPNSEYQRKIRDNMNVLHNHVSTNHSKEAIAKLKMIPVGMGKEVLPKNLLTKSIYSGTWSRMIGNEQSVTITTRFDTPSSGRFTHPILNRCITVREAARLQSFPDSFIFYGKKSSQMKQVGNAVPPLLGKAIGEIIIKDEKKDNSNPL